MLYTAQSSNPGSRCYRPVFGVRSTSIDLPHSHLNLDVLEPRNNTVRFILARDFLQEQYITYDFSQSLKPAPGISLIRIPSTPDAAKDGLCSAMYICFLRYSVASWANQKSTRIFVLVVPSLVIMLQTY